MDTLSINDISLKPVAHNEEKSRDIKNNILIIVGGSVVFLLLVVAVFLAVIFPLFSNEDQDTGVMTETFPPTTQDPKQTAEPITQDPISTMDPSSISPTTQNPTQTTEPIPMPSEVDFSIIGWESICSENTNMVYCDDGECSSSYYQGADYDGCHVRCRPDSCRNTEFINSAVECFGSSCGGGGGRFIASAVVCEGNACDGATFMACSCCDGDGCPDHIPSCKNDPIGFCSSTELGLDCLTWGNPVCWALEVEDSGTLISDNDTKTVICEGNQCYESYFDSKSVLCVDDCSDSTSWASNLECHEMACTSTRDRLMIVQNSTVACLTASCQWAYFQESDVMCDTYPSCANAFFRNERSITCTDGACLDASIVGSPVQCSNGSCEGTNIEVSNVTCSDSSCARATIDKSLVDCHGISCFDASISRSVVTCDFEGCYSTSFKECTCCDGPGCPEVDDDRKTLQSCKDDVEAFCTTDFDGKTCAEWGNPLCKPETIDSSLVEDIPKKLCENDDAYYRPSNCRPFETFYQSEVECLGTESCWYTSLFSVEYSTFFASRVNCAGGEACGPSTFLGCSCCEGDCNATYEISGEEGLFGPGLSPSCTENPTAFCNSTYLGRSCASWGNPVCKGMEYTDTEPASVAIVCVDNTCRGLHVESSGVACFEQDCWYGNFYKSDVECFHESCFCIFTAKSTVSCRESSCSGSHFSTSKVFCESSDACVDAQFDACSCCDGPGCPTYLEDDTLLPSCVIVTGENASSSFCASLSASGQSCNENPACNGYEDEIII